MKPVGGGKKGIYQFSFHVIFFLNENPVLKKVSFFY